MGWGALLGLGVGAGLVYLLTKQKEPSLRTTPGKPSGPVPKVGDAGRAVGIRPEMPLAGTPTVLLSDPDMTATPIRPLVNGEPLAVMAVMSLPDGSVFLRVRTVSTQEGFIPSVWFEPTGQKV